MHGLCFDYPLQKWFEFKVPKPSVASDVIKHAIEETALYSSAHSKVSWLGKLPQTEIIQKSKKGSKWETMALKFQTLQVPFTIQVDPHKGEWLLQLLPKIDINNKTQLTLQQVKQDYEAAGLEDFELFWDNKPMNTMRKAGLLMV